MGRGVAISSHKLCNLHRSGSSLLLLCIPEQHAHWVCSAALSEGYGHVSGHRPERSALQHTEGH